MSAGQVATSDALEIDGYHLAVPSVEIHTVGAGGGHHCRSRWGRDAVCRAQRAAGARPGPACYGHGGTEPTVTDAQLVLGRLAPGAYAGGSVTLNRGARPRGDPARASPSRLESVSRMPRQASSGWSSSICCMQWSGFPCSAASTPPDSPSSQPAGAGPLHGPSVAAMLGARRVYVPRQAGAFCAMGLLQSDVRQDYIQVFMRDLDGDAAGATQVTMAAQDGFAQLRARATEDAHPGRLYR